AWGPECVRHLRGDFAFAIWDAAKGELFCARDHFGIKPFYYAALGGIFLFSNTLDCLRRHPSVSGERNEAAIGDFLLFGVNCDPATSTFRDIQRLPPAHTLTVSTQGVRTQRYWSPPIDGHIRYRRPADYIEHFRELFQAAVADRLSTNCVGILLSGGLDSGSIAATAREISGNSGGSPKLRAYTVVYNSLIPDRDGSQARKTAEHLGIPIQCLAVDDLRPFEGWSDPAMHWPEPVDDPFFAGIFQQFRLIAADTRVALDGEGSDNLMHFEMWPYAKDLLRRAEWRQFMSDVPRYLWTKRSSQRGLRRRVKNLFRGDSGAPDCPKWIEPDFARRIHLADRWKSGGSLPSVEKHPLLPEAHASLSLPHWTQLFELGNAGVTRTPVEVRYPFLDLRLVDFLLALPPYPWILNKNILRESMAGRLLESIRTRAKMPLVADPLVRHLGRGNGIAVDKPCWVKEIDRYINRSALPALAGENNSERVSLGVRPLCLNFWLQSTQQVGYNLSAEARNESACK
ncbi:MAG: asparagine synthetase B family protein, partial [Candidatus Acidiferrales bacterium]